MNNGKTLSEEERLDLFVSYIDVKDQDSCWPWLGCITKDGYGQFTWPGYNEKNPKEKKFYAHRIMFEFFWKRKLGKKRACHTCDNPPCCNPWHLFKGTHQDNMEDMVTKGRSAKGVQNGNVKLNDSQVKEIRRLLFKGKTRYNIARRFEVSWNTIDDIHSGKRWQRHSV